MYISTYVQVQCQQQCPREAVWDNFSEALKTDLACVNTLLYIVLETLKNNNGGRKI